MIRITLDEPRCVSCGKPTRHIVELAIATPNGWPREPLCARCAPEIMPVLRHGTGGELRAEPAIMASWI